MRLIDVDDAINKINDLCVDGNENWIGTENQSFVDHADVIDILSSIPTVDAVILPCNIGDTVWTIMYGEIREAKVICIRPFVFEDFVEFRGNAVITMAHPYYSDGRTLTQEPFIIFGKDTFLTREEAEAALSKMDGGNEE